VPHDEVHQLIVVRGQAVAAGAQGTMSR
jgi:hypothetical protein